jgi:hippurate hydrolase
MRNSMQTLTTHTLGLYDEMQGWRHDIHRHPELAFEENRTAGMVAQLLTSWGLDVERGIGNTGVVGVLKRGNGSRSIGLRADMDALGIQEQNSFDHRSVHNEKMHACGHDGHTAMLLGAARHLAGQGEFDGTAVLIFQPAEEHGEGARAMIDDGLFERFPVDAVYAIHNFPSLATGRFAVRAGSIMAAEDNFEITIDGVGCHAAMPHLGRDPIVIGAEIVTAMQSLVARTLNPMEHAVVSFTEFITNGTVNVVPGQVVLKGDTRSLTPEVQDHIATTMARIVAGVCAAHGVDHSFDYRRNFVPTINSPAEAVIAAEVAAAVVGAEQVVGDSRPVMTSEDFGYMLRAKPGAYILLGNGEGGVGSCSLHNPAYDFNDEILCIGADFWVELVQSQLTPF